MESLSFPYVHALQVDRYRQRIGELEKSVDRMTSDLKVVESRRRELENQLMMQESAWNSERAELEEKAKKVRK